MFAHERRMYADIASHPVMGLACNEGGHKDIDVAGAGELMSTLTNTRAGELVGGALSAAFPLVEKPMKGG